MGLNPELVSKGTIEEVVKAYPRKGWSGCFAKTIKKESMYSFACVQFYLMSLEP